MNSTQSIVRSVIFALLALPFVASAEHETTAGAVYTISNDAASNQVLAFPRDERGHLGAAVSYDTGGKGTGSGLGDQGALALTQDGRWLLVVNAGTNDISSFSVHRGRVELTDTVPSGGRHPISVTVADNLVYVLNAGGAVGATDNISGFYLTEQGKLHALAGSTQSLSAGSVAPAQVSFGRHGDVLVVTEKGTSRVDTFLVDDLGRAGPVVSIPSSGATPFGFAVSSHGYVLVSEAVNSSLSSYRIGSNGGLTLLSGSIADHQAAACWVVLSKNERFAYVANAATNTISGYSVAGNGKISLLDGSGITAYADNHPLDMAVSRNGRFLYSLNTGSHTLVGFRIGEDGSLTRISSAAGLPTASAGVVAR